MAGNGQIAAGWLTHPAGARRLTDARAQSFLVGRGQIGAVEADTGDHYLAAVVQLLAGFDRKQPLNGFDGRNDGKLITDFPRGRLVFDEKTFSSTFVPKAPGGSVEKQRFPSDFKSGARLQQLVQ